MGSQVENHQLKQERVICRLTERNLRKGPVELPERTTRARTLNTVKTSLLPSSLLPCFCYISEQLFCEMGITGPSSSDSHFSN